MKITRSLFIFFLTIITLCPSSFPKNFVLFSPYDKPTSQLINLINQSKSSIDAAIYMLTDGDIAQALINAHTRGVSVRVVTDIISTDKYGKANQLAENGLPVYVLDVNARTARSNATPKQTIDLAQLFLKKRRSFKEERLTKNFTPQKSQQPAKTMFNDRGFSNDPIMHHKFIIIDGILLWTGSFNWTSAANKKNYENVLATDDRDVCKLYSEHFSQIINDGSCKPYYPGRISAYMPTSLAGKVLAAVNQINKEPDLAQELLEIVKNHKICTLDIS